MDTHFVDQYIRNKKRSENQQQPPVGYNSNISTSSSSAAPAAPTTIPHQQPQPAPAAAATTTSYNQMSSSSTLPYPTNNIAGPVGIGRAPSLASTGAAYRSGSVASGGGGMINQAAHHVLLSHAQRAQAEVDAVNSAAADIALREEQNERMERQYSLLSERVDTSSLQVAAAEDKVINVTKMLKMLQQLSEDREKTLRDESTELRTKVKRLERALDQERESREKMSESMTTYIRETVERALEKQNLGLRADFTRQLDQFDTTLRNVTRTTDELKGDVDEVRRAADKFNSVLREVEAFCTRFADDTRSSTKSMIESRLEEYRIRQDGHVQKVDDMRAKVEDNHDRLNEVITSQHDFRRSLEEIKRRSDPLKDWCEGQMAQLRDDVRTQVAKESDNLTQKMHMSLANTNSILEATESNVNDLREELERLAGTMHAHVKNVDSQNLKAAESFQDLRDLSTQSRDLLVNQLEATKDWASRNILRLKKHLDLATSDMAATRQAQLEIQVQFQRLTQAHNDEKGALTAQLAHKTKEAALLTNAVDKEVAEVAAMMTGFEESRRHAQMKRQARDELQALSHMP